MLFLDEDGDVGIDCGEDGDMLSLRLRADGRMFYAWRNAYGQAGSGVSYLPPHAFEILRKMTANVK